MAAKFEVRSPKAGEFRWVLVSQGRTLATSESYTRKVSAEKAIESLREAAGTATVADLTLAAAKTTAKRAAKKVEKAAAKTPAAAKTTAKRAAKKVEKVTKKAATAVKPTRAAKKSAAPPKGTSRAG
jgi:DNA-binding protein HU-beta